MKNLTTDFGTIFPAIKALVIHREKGEKRRVYVQAYDFDADGYPINAHPLSITECNKLAKILDIKQQSSRAFLKPKGLLPKNILGIDPDQNSVIWYTPVQRKTLFFHHNLEMPDGKAFVPALIWKADTRALKVYAIKHNGQIIEDTPLFHAPFFNIYRDARVCMGTVKLEFSANCTLDDFINKWEAYFFNSYFSHHIDGHQPVKENLLLLWKKQLNSHAKFPLGTLMPTGFTLKSIL